VTNIYSLSTNILAYEKRIHLKKHNYFSSSSSTSSQWHKNIRHFWTRGFFFERFWTRGWLHICGQSSSL